MLRQANLSQVVPAVKSGRRTTNRLNRWQQNGQKEANQGDCDNDLQQGYSTMWRTPTFNVTSHHRLIYLRRVAVAHRLDKRFVLDTAKRIFHDCYAIDGHCACGRIVRVRTEGVRIRCVPGIWGVGDRCVRRKIKRQYEIGLIVSIDFVNSMNEAVTRVMCCLKQCGLSPTGPCEDSSSTQGKDRGTYSNE